jgi:hypothetical protein
MEKTVQISLEGRKVQVSKGFIARVKRLQTTYKKKPQNYESTFQDLMKYKVIQVDKIKSIEDFRQVALANDTRHTISDTLLDALEQTFEYKEMVIEKIRYNNIELKTKSVKGFIMQEANAYLFIDRLGSLRAHELGTGRFAKMADYYGTVPLTELKRFTGGRPKQKV